MHAHREPNRREDVTVDLTVWIPATAGLGLLTMALLFAFLEACDKV